MEPVPFFTDDIKIVPHSASAELKEFIGKPVALGQVMAKLPQNKGSLYKTEAGEYYLRGTNAPAPLFVEGPEFMGEA